MLLAATIKIQAPNYMATPKLVICSWTSSNLLTTEWSLHASIMPGIGVPVGVLALESYGRTLVGQNCVRDHPQLLFNLLA